MDDVREPENEGAETLDSPEPDHEVPLEHLEAEITELAAYLDAATYCWLGLVGEFDRREGWAAWGCRSADTEKANGRHARRYLRYFWDDDGCLSISGRLSPEDGAVVVAGLRAAGLLADQRRRGKGQAGDHATTGQGPTDEAGDNASAGTNGNQAGQTPAGVSEVQTPAGVTDDEPSTSAEGGCDDQRAETCRGS